MPVLIGVAVGGGGAGANAYRPPQQLGPSLTGMNHVGQSVSQYGTYPNNAAQTTGSPMFYGNTGSPQGGMGYQMGNVAGLVGNQGAGYGTTQLGPQYAGQDPSLWPGT